MADKIVQLQDKQGNNVFPITGGMAADSVTTDMIQDGAVTSDKIANGAVTASKLGSDINIPTITMTTTDPGEGAALAANSFIGVYE